MTTGIMKKYYPSDDLAEFMGSSSKVTRAQVVKAIWAHAKDEDLNTTKNVKGRNMAAIKPDEYLKPILGSKISGIGDVARAISNHLKD